MKAFFQPLVGEIRVGLDADVYGKAWDYSITCVSSDPESCVLLGLKSDGNFSTAHRRAIYDCLKRRGFKQVQWERIKGGRHRLLTIRIK